MSISILVLTYNEEVNLPASLERARWSDDIHVVDSGSTDRTAEIARALGAQVHRHPFENFAAQRNWALRNAAFRHDWVLVLDADERTPPGLAEEICRGVEQAPAGVAGFEMRRKVYFLNQWVPHAGQFPQLWFLRLFRHRTARYEDRSVNEYPLVDGEVRRLQHALIHENRKGVTDLVTKFNRYATLEAEETLRLRRGAAPSDLPARLTGSPAERRRWLKHLSMRLPFRALLKFLYLYVWRRGFLDGVPGFVYCALMAVQEFFVAAKLGARKRRLAAS